MTIDPESLQEIKNLLQTEIKQLILDVDDKIERQRREIIGSQRSAIAEIKGAIAEVIDENIKETFSQYSDDFDFLKQAREEYESSDDEDDEEDTAVPQDIQSLREQLKDQLMKEFEAQNAKTRQQMEKLMKDQEIAEKGRLEAEQKALISQQRSQALEEIRKLGIVNPGKEQRLLAILEQDGQLKLTDEGYKIPGKNKFGDDVQQAIAEALPTLIESSYDEYAAPRAGTGTGSQPGTRNYTPTRDFSGMSSQQIYDQMRSDPSAEKDLIAALEQQYRG